MTTGSKGHVQSVAVLKKSDGAEKVGYGAGRKVSDVLDDVLNFADSKDGSSDIITKAATLNDVGGNNITINDEEFTASSTLKLNRYSSLTSNDKQSWPNAVIKWIGAVGGKILKTEPNLTVQGVTLDGDNTTDVIGLEIGDDTAYDAYFSFDKMWLKNNDIGIRASNCFDTDINKSRISNNRVGVHIDPVAFTGDGGYTTTFRIKHSYITDNDEHGVLDSAPIQNKMFTIQDSVIEKNGTTTIPQIEMLNGGQVNYLTGLYVEDGTSSIPAIKFNKGALRDLYINGYSTAIDLGSRGSQVTMENIKFASSNATPVSVTSSGGANAVYASMKRCEFDGAPTLDSRIQIFDGCSGDMPIGIPEYAWVMTGAKPQWGVGTTPAITRDIEAWLHTDAGTTVAANSVYRFNVTIPVGRMADGATALSITPQSDLPVGLSATVARVSTTVARVTITNPTGSNIVLGSTDYLMRMEQYAQVNT